MAEAKKKSAKKQNNLNKTVTTGRVYVLATFNNTIVNITDEAGNTLFTASSGSVGFKGARKSTPYAATAAVETAAKEAWEAGMRSVAVFIKGPGAGRDAALRTLKTMGFDITMIADITPLAHNGPRPKKKRRV